MNETRLKILLTASVILADAVWIVAKGFSFDMQSLWLCAGATAGMAALAWFYTHIRPDERIATMATETAFLVVFSGAACILSYLTTSLDLPLIDASLARWDSALGFDWHAYVAFANAHHWIGVLSSFVYQTTLVQIGAAVVVLTTLGMGDRTRELLLVVMVSAVICDVMAGLLPAAGALAYYHPAAAFYMQNDPVVDLAYKQTFFAMRDGMMTHLSLIGAQGLVSLPSYHVALSVILMITFRGVKPLFWPIVALNTLVIASTPIDGGHHMVDGFAGAALAVLSSLAVIKFRARYFPAKPHTDATAEPAYTDLAGQKA